MTGICWRLLAVFSLILFLGALVAPPLLGSQEAADAARFPASLPSGASNLPPSRFSPPIVPVWIPPPSLPPRPYPGAPVSTVFQRLVRSAGIIFSGRVIFIGHDTSSSGPGSSSNAVTFQVEQAMRGAAAGRSLTIHEWAGLWASGERYRVGDRLLLFLYAPGKLGLTSPVAGDIGRFALNSRGMILIDARQVQILAADPILGGRTVVPYRDFMLAVRRLQPRGVSEP